VRGDGRRFVLKSRIWRVPTGIEVELEEFEVPVGAGYHFAVSGVHDANSEEPVASMRSRAEAEISRRYHEPLATAVASA
jgi:hypothetical protein